MKMRVTINDQEFEVEIADLKCRPIIATVDGQSFEVWPEGSAPAADTPVEAAPVFQAAGGAPVPLANPGKAVTAPIPGTIVAVLVKEGQAVKLGQELLTLEAMKMKNAIKATREGKIGAIHVQVGDQVRHSQVLIEYAD
jgi:biotin carboxyl carrier protein